MIYLVKLILRSALLGCLLLCVTSAADSPQPPQPIRISYSQRIRIETSDNCNNVSTAAANGSSYIRNRSTVMLQGTTGSYLTFTARLANEFRYYFVPEARQFGMDEVFFDLLNVRWDSVGHLPIDLIAGRQNISLGEGFVIYDGGPLDGSRSAYFNAVTAIWHADSINALYASYANQTRQDHLLPIIHNQHKGLVEQPEEAIIFYYSGRLGRLGTQSYAIRKHLDATESIAGSNVNCVGGRLQYPVLSRLTLTSEVAAQIGKWQAEDQHAFGGYAYAEYKTGWPMHLPKSFTIGGLYLSGDNPSTVSYEGWEPMFGRWPKWSESYAYTLVKERAVAYWTNIASIYARTSVDLSQGLTLSLDYHHLMAPQLSNPETSFPGGSGKTRGELYIGKLAYKMSEHVSGHFIFEEFGPGNYYFSGANHSGWSRMEIMLNF